MTGLGMECFGVRVGDMGLYSREPCTPKLAPSRTDLAAVDYCTAPIRAAPRRAERTERAWRTRRPDGERRTRRRPLLRDAPNRRAKPERRDERHPESDATVSNALEVARTTSTTNATTTSRSTSTPTHVRFSLPHLPGLTALPATDPLLPSCLLLLPAHPHARPLLACRRPTSGPPASCLGCPARFIWQVEEGPVQREAVDGPSSKAQAWCGFLSRRRGGGLVRSKANHLERTTYNEPPRTNQGVRPSGAYPAARGSAAPRTSASMRSAAELMSSCSQTTISVQPASASARSFRRSRATLRSSFGSQ